MAKSKASKDFNKDNKLLQELGDHFNGSDRFQETIRGTWDDKEAILVGGLKDDISTSEAKSQVFDPRLSTIVIERAARVMAQNPTGKAYAVSKNDIGKSKMMNLLLDKYVAENANYQFDYLIKDRMWNLYSQVYGVMFGLVDWVNDDTAGYYGPNFWLLPIRDCFPQPGALSIEDSDWFQVSTLKTKQWLEDRDKDTWKNIDVLLRKLKDSKGVSKENKDSDRRGYYERTKTPNIPSDGVFPLAEIITEYRRDKWITYAPEHDLVLREIDNPHKNGKLPIVAKHCFPLLDSIYGLGEVERGKTLQYAINSLINLYLDGVKMSIFPPIQINPDAQGLVPSSIKFGAAEKWLVGRPNVDIQQLNLSPQGINSFQSTYQFLVAALLNQAGTTDTTVSKQTDPGLGKTPAALKIISARENARDSWDRFMMERALKERNSKYIELLSEKMEKPITLRLFATELEELVDSDPDVVEMFDSGERGSVKISKKLVDSKYDYEIESGSTMKREPDEELSSLTNILQFVLSNPQVLQIMPQQAQELGKQPQTIDLSELFKKWVVAGGVQDWDKILVDIRQPQQPEPQQPQSQPVPGPQEAVQQDMQMGQQLQGITDPQIAQAAQQLMQLGGIGGIPTNE